MVRDNSSCLGSWPPRRIQHVYRHDNDYRCHQCPGDAVSTGYRWNVFINQTDYSFHLPPPILPTQSMQKTTNQTDRIHYRLIFRSCLCLFSTCNHIARIVAHIARKIATHIMPRVKVTRYRYCSISIRGFSPVRMASNPKTTVSVNRINASNITTHVRLT